MSRILAAICVFLLCAAAGAAQPLKIVARDARAGEFLRQKLELILGQKDFSRGKITLHVGNTALARGIDLSKKTLGEFGYRLLCRDGKNILIAGATPTATLFAAGDFLKRFAGWRYFYPGKTGEVLPRLEKLALPRTFDICEIPSILHYNSSSGQRDDIFSRTRERNIYYATNHAMDKIVPPAKYAATHPEYYPVRYGKRIDIKKFDRMGWNPCISNPDMPMLMREYLKALGRKHVRNVTLSVNDGGGDCQCPECTALFMKYGNQYAEFYKACNDEIGGKYPGKLGVFIAYGIRSNQAPVGIKFGPHIMAVICGARPGIYDRELEAWKNAGVSNIGIYDYMYTFGHGYMVPRFYPRDLAAKWRRAAKYGLKALILEVYTQSAVLDAPRLYIMDELGWDLNADVDKLLADYCLSMFGPGVAGTVAEFYARLEKIFCRKLFPSYYSDRRKPCQFDNWTLEDLDLLKNLLGRAEKASMTPLQRRRLELLKSAFSLSALCIEVAVRGRDAEKVRMSPEETAAFVRKGYEALRKLREFRLKPEDESEIFIPPRRKRGDSQSSPLAEFKRYHIDGLLQPLLDHGSMAAFERAAAELGPEKAAEFQRKHRDLPPARCQLERPSVKVRNLISNPGFEPVPAGDGEEKGAADWDRFPAPGIGTWTAVSAQFVHSEKIRHSGGYSGMIGESEGSSCFIGRERIPLKPGSWYRFRIHVRREGKNLGGPGYYTLRFSHNGKAVGAAVTWAGSDFTLEQSGKWYCLTRYFRAPEVKGGLLTARWLAGVNGQPAGSALFFDDLELCRISK